MEITRLRLCEAEAGCFMNELYDPVGFIKVSDDKCCKAGRVMIGKRSEWDEYIACCSCGKTFTEKTYKTPLEALQAYLKDDRVSARRVWDFEKIKFIEAPEIDPDWWVTAPEEEPQDEEIEQARKKYGDD